MISEEEVDQFIKSFYATISGEEGKFRNWRLFRSFFHPEARLYYLDSKADSSETIAMSVNDWIQEFPEYFSGRVAPIFLSISYLQK